MIETETRLVYRGIKPLQKLGAQAKALAINNMLYELAKGVRTPDELEVVPPDPWPGDMARGRDMIQGIFTFHEQTLAHEDLSWKPAGVSEKWIAELHGFDWLRDLRAVGGDRGRRMARDMVTSWMALQDKYNEVTWAPDVLGTRIAAWISFHDFFCASASDEFRHKYFTSLTKQAKHLSRSFPARMKGLPLLRALKGLAYSGLALAGGEDRLEQAFGLILKQIHDEIMPDGGHISRSPEDTLVFLQYLVDLRAALIAAQLEVPEKIQHAIDRMTPAVRFFKYGDSGLALFNGGQESDPAFCDLVLTQSGAKGRPLKAMPHTGYQRLAMGRAQVIVDVGLPVDIAYADTAHAGLLSLEYAFGRERVIVNCGTSHTSDKWREALRGTPAHSTVTIDGRNACQFDPHGRLSSQPEIRVNRQEGEGSVVLDASHTGYVARYGVAHRRCLKLSDFGEVFSVEEQLGGKSGVPFAIRLHLHPGIQISPIRQGEEALLRARSGAGWRFRVQGAEMSIEESVYCGIGETPRRSQQIVLSGMTASPSTIVVWQLAREKI